MGHKSEHLKLGTGQRDLEEEKSERSGGPLWLWVSRKLLLARQLVFVTREGFLGRCTFSFMPGDDMICNCRCLPFRENSPGPAIDNPWELGENFSNWTWRNKRKKKRPQSSAACPVCEGFNSLGPRACVAGFLPPTQSPLGCLSKLNAPHLFLVFFFVPWEDSHIWDTGGLSSITETSYVLLRHVLHKSLRSSDSAAMDLRVWPHITLTPPTHPSFVVPVWFFFFFSADGTLWLPRAGSCLSGSEPAPSPSARGLLLNQCLTKGWVSPSAQEEEPETGEALWLGGGHTQKLEAARFPSPVQTNSRCKIVFPCP